MSASANGKAVGGSSPGPPCNAFTSYTESLLFPSRVIEVLVLGELSVLDTRSSPATSAHPAGLLGRSAGTLEQSWLCRNQECPHPQRLPVGQCAEESRGCALPPLSPTLSVPFSPLKTQTWFPGGPVAASGLLWDSSPGQYLTPKASCGDGLPSATNNV